MIPLLGDVGVSNDTLAQGLFVFALAAFLGFVLISKVPATLHTPLMSGTNAIHGIVLVGALVVAAGAHDVAGDIIAIAAVFLGTMNVVGGFVVTDRMLEMFKKRPAPGADKGRE
ncbi:MAG TPA: NAD(P) transhydrogenase subunit alpha [Candidatus Dormibacteraeota bacterium]|jgi:NAD(P) transhydrogenase subunit alpha|nr:NAD(P) transhydrogenase subunit alpha [Candidatus Dormibacteraeota bacterium]